MTALLTKGYRAVCPKGHSHGAAPMKPDLLPATCRFPDCGEPLEWEAIKR